MKPVSSVAGLVRPVAELPFTPGSHWVTRKTTVARHLDADALAVIDQSQHAFQFRGEKLVLFDQVFQRNRVLVVIRLIEEVHVRGVGVHELDVALLEVGLGEAIRRP